MAEQKRNSSAVDDVAIAFMILLIAAAAIVFFTPAVVFAVGMTVMSRKFPWYVTAGVLVVSAVGGLLVIYAVGGLETYVQSYFLPILDSLKFVIKGQGWANFPWARYILSCVIFGPPLALVGIVALSFVGDLPGARVKIKKDEKKKGIMENFALAKLSKAKHLPGSTVLGLTRDGKQARVQDRELNQHCFLIGTTGSGKTVTLSNFAESAVQRGIPLIYVDGKGEVKLVEQLKSLAEKHGRKFYLFSVNSHPEGCRWNPLARGKPTELKDKLISITEWTEPHYRYEAERYLQAVFSLFEKLKMRPDIPAVARYLYPKAAQSLARDIKDEELREKLLEELRAGKTVEGLANRIAVLAASEIGHLFRDFQTEKTSQTEKIEKSPIDLNNILGLGAPDAPKPKMLDETNETKGEAEEDKRPILDLDRAIREKAVVLFSLNSLRFREFSQLIGRLVVNDLRTTIARRYDNPERNYIFGIFDEFHVFASLQVVDILAQARGAGFCTIIATQSLSDLDLVDPDLTGRIVENCNTFIIQAQNYPKNAERLAAVIGTRDSFAKTYQVEEHIFQTGTGLGSIRETKEFIVHPDEIKKLHTGEAILLQKASGFRVNRIWVRKPRL
jgi:type IV secretory pathway TraG/TraD family ATPase VirD4